MSNPKPIQVLTDESKMKIRKAIIFIEVVQETLQLESAKERIKELNEILKETEL